jgi:hypothetical protein
MGRPAKTKLDPGRITERAQEDSDCRMRQGTESVWRPVRASDLLFFCFLCPDRIYQTEAVGNFDPLDSTDKDQIWKD